MKQEVTENAAHSFSRRQSAKEVASDNNILEVRVYEDSAVVNTDSPEQSYLIIDGEPFFRIENFPEYFINSYGVVISFKYGVARVLKTVKESGGRYERIGLCKNGVVSRVSLHRLVAETFVPNPDNKPEVNHINGIKTDCRAENLEWVTGEENRQHAVENGMVKGRRENIALDMYLCAQIRRNRYEQVEKWLSNYAAVIDADSIQAFKMAEEVKRVNAEKRHQSAIVECA